MDERPSTIRSLFAELKRRRVFRVAGVYALVAWVVIEAADVIFPALRLPEWSVSLVVGLALLGFPIAIVLAWAFDIGPEGVRRTAPVDAVDTPSGGARPLATRPSVWFVVGLLVALVGAWAIWSRQDESVGAGPLADAEAVVIAPFRVAGADASLSYLRQGMVDLLAAKLDGGADTRALDPQLVINAWQRRTRADGLNLPRNSALRLARELGAGRLLLGNVVGAPDNVVIEAALYDAASGERRAEASVNGAADSLPALVDRLAAALLSLEAGEEEQRLATLTSRSLPALRAYLEGRRELRMGRYQEAFDAFSRALDIDSTFALAGLGHSLAAGWIGGGGERGLRLAWAAQDRLGPRDRVYLEARAGPRYPEPSTAAEMLRARERAVQALPDRAGAWFFLADHIFHHGATLGIDDWRRQSIGYFGRAVALDSANAQSYLHLVPLLLSVGDSAEAYALADAYFERHSDASETSEYLRWILAVARGDSAALAATRARFDSLPTPTLFYLEGTAMLEGIATDDADRAVDALLRRTGTPAERALTAIVAHNHALARGRPQEALRHGRGWEPATPAHLPLRTRVLGALYGDGDTAAAAGAVRELAADAPPPSDPEMRLERLRDDCTVQQWRVWRGPDTDAGPAVRRLRDAAGRAGSVRIVRTGELCASLLEAIAATLADDPDAARYAARVDSLLRQGPLTPAGAAETMDLYIPATLALARLYELQGRPDAARAVGRRRPYWSAPSIYLLAAVLHTEGRLAALAGDTADAVRAYRHYLALRSDPEPALQPQADRVRAALTQLTGDPAR